MWVVNIYLLNHINLVLTKCSKFNLKAFKNFILDIFLSSNNLMKLLKHKQTKNTKKIKNVISHVDLDPELYNRSYLRLL